jgi:catechol 2,3-dioxygenase-like lactoylglutathione lyase family enzyme
MNPPRSLWIPLEVNDFDEARAFYVDRMRLSEVDSWAAEAEQGCVLSVGAGAFIELVSPTGGRGAGPPPLAFEMRTTTEVDAMYPAMAPSSVKRAPSHYPRGHYGFEVHGPANTVVMVWTETPPRNRSDE